MRIDAVSYTAHPSLLHLSLSNPLHCVSFCVRISVVVLFSFGVPLCLLILLIYFRKDIKELGRLDKMTEGLTAAAKATFANFDINGDGTISPAELRAAMAELGHALSEDECHLLFVKMDSDRDGNISESEFTKMAVAFKPAEGTMSKLVRLASARGLTKGGMGRLRSLSRSRTSTTTSHAPDDGEMKTANNKTESVDDGSGGGAIQEVLETQRQDDHGKKHLRHAVRLAVLYSIYKP